ncbi:MAG: hypothetical protein PHF56_16535 [Desulfuromonadaceae bacterium]|nr:hypothetical protein [Desulfuromonadaceae bacterium]
MNKADRAVFSPDFKSVITSEGEQVALDDPRVAHVWPTDMTPYGLEYIRHFYENRGMRCRVASRTSPDTLNSAKGLSNGRECIPVVAMLGEVYEDLTTKRREDEITIYYIFYGPGPCQHGGWILMFDTFLERMKLKNVIFMAAATPMNNYLGNGYLWSFLLTLGYAMGDIMDEAENTIRVLAKDPQRALPAFKEACGKALKSASRGYVAIEPALREWAAAVRDIELKMPLEEAPKVLISGGGNIFWLHYPVTDYFVERGIVPKLAESTEFMYFAERTMVTMNNFQIGKGPADQGFKLDGIFERQVGHRASPAEKAEGEIALDVMSRSWMTEHFIKWLRSIAVTSGALFDDTEEFEEVFQAGSHIINPVCINESCSLLGKLLTVAKSEVYDGIVSMRVFNCPIAGGTTAILSATANEMEMPFAAIDVEGPSISANQKRLLETVAVQAVRNRSRKNRACSGSLD